MEHRVFSLTHEQGTDTSIYIALTPSVEEMTGIYAISGSLALKIINHFKTIVKINIIGVKSGSISNDYHGSRVGILFDWCLGRKTFRPIEMVALHILRLRAYL